MIDIVKNIRAKQLALNILLFSLVNVSGAYAEDGAVIEPVFGATNVLQVVLSLVFILVLVVGLAWLVKRLQLGNLMGDRQQMKVIAALNLGGRERLLIVQVGEQKMLVGVAPGHVSYLKDIESSDVADAVHTGNGKRFFSAFKVANQQVDGERSND